jgi:ornithine cyclodeaminase
VVTASRSTRPLFDGHALASGCFVAAIGSSLPTRELDDVALRRAPRRLRSSGAAKPARGG